MEFITFLIMCVGMTLWLVGQHKEHKKMTTTGFCLNITFVILSLWLSLNS